MGSISLKDRDGVAVVALDRPPANAISVELLAELVSTLESVAAERPKALVMAGRPGFFSAGVDLKAVPSYGPEEQRQMVEGINRMVLTVYPMPFPVVGAVTGHAIAGGFVLAVCADFRVASLEGRYGLTEIKVGVPYPQAAIGVVRAELAPPAARKLVLGNELIGGEEAARLGVFDEAVPPDQVLARAHEIAVELGAMPHDVYARTKADLRGSALSAMKDAVAAEPLLEGWI
jgi:enoyl-CoA hydratase